MRAPIGALVIRRIDYKIGLMAETKPQLSWTKPLLLDEGIRSVICMLPMVGALLMGQTSVVSAMGQGGFYFAYLPLPQKTGQRFVMGSLLLTLGLGFYLMGGNVVFNPWLSVFFTFLVGMNLVFLTSWRLLGMLAFSFVSIYSAGLNASSPDKVHQSFMAFVLAIGWAALVSMLPIWKGTPPPPVKPKESTQVELLEAGIRMGVGTSIALFIAQFVGFSKMGWAPSGVGNVIRFDVTTSKIRAKLRMFGTIVGAVILMVSLLLTNNLKLLALLTLVYAFINGLTKATKLGQTVTMYTATIMTLYVMNDLSTAPLLSMQRIIYNLIGVMIGVWIAMYPFPRIFSRIRRMTATTGGDVQT